MYISTTLLVWRYRRPEANYLGLADGEATRRRKKKPREIRFWIKKKANQRPVSLSSIFPVRSLPGRPGSTDVHPSRIGSVVSLNISKHLSLFRSIFPYSWVFSSIFEYRCVSLHIFSYICLSLNFLEYHLWVSPSIFEYLWVSLSVSDYLSNNWGITG